jgi:quinohemoprotein amine dehydrogenase beta subunit
MSLFSFTNNEARPMLLHKTGKFLLAGLLAAALSSVAPAANARDYLLTGAKPDKLYMIDVAARKIEKTYTVPNADDYISTIVPSPDAKRVYVLTNHLNSISGIDLDTGAQVFRANFSEGDVDIKSFLSFEISTDGKEIYVYQLRSQHLPAEYKELEPRIAVYRTDGGLDAKPVRTFPAPRRIHMLMAAKDGKSLYALGFDLYKYDLASGKIVSTTGVRNWKRPNYSIPDVLDFWPLWDQTGVFSTPFYANRTDLKPGDPNTAKSGLMTLDLTTGAVHFADFETTAVLMFSSVISPGFPNEAFAVYTQLTKIDREKNVVVKRVDLPHTYYAANISSDGKEVYLGGTMCDIGIYDHDSLARLGEVNLPGCGDMSITSVRMIHR